MVTNQSNLLSLLTRNIKLCGPHTTLRICKRGSSAVQVCFRNGATRTVSTIGAEVSARLLAVVCLGATGQSVDGHLIMVH